MIWVVGFLAALAALIVGIWAFGRLAPGVTSHFLLRLRRRLAKLEDRRLSIADFTIVFSDGGGDATPVVMLHGLGADRSSFETIALPMSRRHRLIIPDLPGFGESSRDPDADYGVPAQVERVARWVDALGLPRFHLAGNSLGGWVAAAYAAKYPDKVLSLCLIAAAGTEDMLHTEAVKVWQERREYQLLAKRPEDFRAVLQRICYRLPPLPYCLLWYVSHRAAANFPLHARIFDELIEFGEKAQMEPLLPTMKTPTLLVWGEHDKIVPLAVMERYRSLMPNAQVMLMREIGHVPQVEAPRQVAEAYNRFIDSVMEHASC